MQDPLLAAAPPTRPLVRPGQWIIAGLLLLVALVVSRVTVAEPRVSTDLAVWSVLLAASWAALAAWLGIGARWWPRSEGAVGVTLALCVACSGASVMGVLVFEHFGILESELTTLAGRAAATSLWLTWIVALIAGTAEELVFRGALYSRLAPRHHPVILSTAGYALAMSFSGQGVLLIAAVGVGLASAMARYFSGSLVAAILVHGTWTTTMTFALPSLLGLPTGA